MPLTRHAWQPCLACTYAANPCAGPRKGPDTPSDKGGLDRAGASFNRPSYPGCLVDPRSDSLHNGCRPSYPGYLADDRNSGEPALVGSALDLTKELKQPSCPRSLSADANLRHLLPQLDAAPDATDGAEAGCGAPFTAPLPKCCAFSTSTNGGRATEAAPNPPDQVAASSAAVAAPHAAGNGSGTDCTCPAAAITTQRATVSRVVSNPGKRLQAAANACAEGSLLSVVQHSSKADRGVAAAEDHDVDRMLSAAVAVERLREFSLVFDLTGETG